MKAIKFILNFKLKQIIRDSILPVGKNFDKKCFPRLLNHLRKIYFIVFDDFKAIRIRDRLVMTNNFLQFVSKMIRNHGAVFTVKWLKACTVCLQKWLGDDTVKSLREIEPGLPLPRVINGCPAIINRHDRKLMRSGNKHIIRYWHSLFSIYRVLKIPGKIKLETITAPYKGSVEYLNKCLEISLNTKWQASIQKICQDHNLAPTTFHMSGKASPSNVNSSTGILSDIYYLLAHPDGAFVFSNILKHLEVVGSVWNTQSFLQRLNDGAEIVKRMSSIQTKCSMRNPFGQFAIKEEAAGKVRVFALVDSITQSVMKPIHLGLFKVLRHIPNDGTFDQDASVTRCSEKASVAGKAFSFDLSAATDRLPVSLTGNIIESLFRIPGLSQSWQNVMVDRNFRFPLNIIENYDIEDIDYRYSVGQPMGCLSSWAGLAITHHWIMQLCSYLVTDSWDWEERYEILGDDIVIFDEELANTYLQVMEWLGLDINLSKSIISKNKPTFEFAKRTFSGGSLVSGITGSQINSCTSLSSRVNSVYSWIKLGYLNNLETITIVLNKFNTKFSYKDFSLSASAFSLLGLCKNIEHKILMSSLVNPSKGCLWDMETENFQVPTRTLLTMARDLITKGESEVTLPRMEGREEWFEESEQLIVAGVLQRALYRSRLLSLKYEESVREWAIDLGHLKNKEDQELLPSIEGWLLDALVDNRSSALTDPFELEDKVEKLLTYHAKTNNVILSKAYELLQEVENLEYLYKQPTKKSQQLYDRLSNNTLRDITTPFFMSGPEYWSVPSPNNFN